MDKPQAFLRGACLLIWRAVAGGRRGVLLPVPRGIVSTGAVLESIEIVLAVYDSLEGIPYRISLAHYAITCVRGWAANSIYARVNLTVVPTSLDMWTAPPQTKRLASK